LTVLSLHFVHRGKSVISKAATEVNEALRIVASRARLTELQGKVKASPQKPDKKRAAASPAKDVDLGNESMAIVREGSAMLRIRKDNGHDKWKKVHLFVFSDCFCVAKTQEKRTKMLRHTMKFQFQEVFDLAQLAIRLPKADPDPEHFCFKMSTKVGEGDTALVTAVVVAFPTANERRDWVASVEGAKKYLKQKK
jgi:PH domain